MRIRTLLHSGITLTVLAVTALAACGAVAEEAYLSTDGTQYFNSGYFPKPTTRIVADYAFNAVTPVQQRIFGENGAAAGLSCCHYINGSGCYAYTFKDDDGDWTSTGITVTTDRRTFEIDSPNNFVRILTGTAVTYSNRLSTARTATAVYPLLILGNAANALGTPTVNPFGNVKFYSLQIYESGTLVHDYRPWKSPTHTGLKDAVTGTVFLTQAGSDPSAVNVTVEADPVLTWTGAVDSDWATAGNWKDAADATPALPPQASDHVVIPAGSTVSLSNLVTRVPSLTLSGPGTVTLTGCVPKVVTDSLVIPGGVTLSLDGTLYAEAVTVDGTALASGTAYTSAETWLAAGTVNLGADSATLADGVLTLTVSPGHTLRHTDQLTASITKVVKLGPGTAIVSNDLNSTFGGTVEVREGFLEAQSGLYMNHTVLGNKKANTVTVSKGAQLIVRVPGPQGQGDLQFQNEFVIAGSGPDGMGAIRCYRYSGKSGSQGNNDGLFRYITLADDAMIRNEARIGVSYGTVDIGSHTLTLSRGSGGFMFYTDSVWIGNGGRIVCADGLVPCSQNKSTFKGTGTIEFPAGSANGFQFWSSDMRLDTGAKWTIKLGNGTYFAVGAGTGDASNTLPLDVELGEGSGNFTIYTGTTGLKQTLTGVISGAGKFVKKGQHTLFVNGQANTWTGGTRAMTESGTGPVVFTYPGGLPSRTTSGAVTIDGGAILAIRPGEGYWTQSDANTLVGNATLDGWLGLYAPSGTAALSGDWPAKKVHLRKLGAGTVTLDGDLNAGIGAAGQFLCEAGAMTFGGQHLYRTANFTLKSGTLNVTGGAYLNVTNADTTIGGSNVTAAAKVTVGEGSALVTIARTLTDLSQNPGFNSTYMGDTGTKAAVLDIDGGVVTAKLCNATSSANQKAAIYLRRGELVQYSGPTADGYLSQVGYGYLGQEGGSFKVRAHTGMMRQPGSVGIYDLKGGTFSYLDSTDRGCYNFALSRGGGHGELYMTGGTFDGATGGQKFHFGIQGWSYPTGGLAVATVDGSNALLKVSMVDMGERLTNFVSVLNVLAGTVQANYIEHSVTTRHECPGYINLNGGTLRGAANNSDYFGSGTKACARVTVFERGFTFDTAGFTQTISAVAIQAPSGKGIQSITIPSGVATNGYFGPSEVTITGDGTGATAHCCYDRETGTIGPIVVTSPGWNYTQATATIKSADRRKTVALAVTLADQRGGGFTKTGAGAFRINASCTYPGLTTVEEGTLVLCKSSALPETNAVRCAGGTLDCNAQTVTLGALGGYGALANGTVTPGKLAFDLADYDADAARTLAVTATLNLTASTPVEIANTNRLVVGKVYTLATATTPFPSGLVSKDLTFPWCLYLANGGKALKLHYQQGTVFVLR